MTGQTRIFKAAAAAPLAAAALLMLGITSAQSAEIVLYQDVPSAKELECVLFKRCSRSLSGSRSVRFKAEAAAIPPQATLAAVEAEPPAQDEPQGTVLGLNIQFEYNSTRILPDSAPYLDRLGQVLSAPDNAASRIMIVGHTDAKGSDEYNLALSMRRAQAVESYLAERHGVDLARLSLRALGESRPLPGLPGLDPQNRRVEFYALNQ